jgi:hypothetical protein
MRLSLMMATPSMAQAVGPRSSTGCADAYIRNSDILGLGGWADVSYGRVNINCRTRLLVGSLETGMAGSFCYYGEEKVWDAMAIWLVDESVCTDTVVGMQVS